MSLDNEQGRMILTQIQALEKEARDLKEIWEARRQASAGAREAHQLKIEELCALIATTSERMPLFEKVERTPLPVAGDPEQAAPARVACKFCGQIIKRGADYVGGQVMHANCAIKARRVARVGQTAR